MSDLFAIRPARPDDLPRLTAIEIDAFATLAQALGVVADARALPHDVLLASLEAGMLLAAADASDNPIGFVAAEEVAGMLYVMELDVERNWQRHGVGRRLMLSAAELARHRGLSAVTLTTDRHVPFNAPFYASLGFRQAATAEMPRFLREKLDHEIADGMDPQRRVAMILAL